MPIESGYQVQCRQGATPRPKLADEVRARPPHRWLSQGWFGHHC
jgi:hypothetical protein